MHISKSGYCSAVQCPKILWLKKNKPELFDDSVLNTNTLENGNEVGDLAMGLFGPYTEVPFGDLSRMIERTRELIDAGTPVICEASFSYDGCFCSVDILRRKGDSYEIYEVKSSTEVKDVYLDDVSYQKYVLEKSGLEISRVYIVHINNSYVRRGELDLRKLFRTVDVTEKAAGKQKEVEDRLAFLNDYLEQDNEPSAEYGEQCSSPFKCGFCGYCIGDLPSPSIFDIAGFRKKMDFFRKGILSFEEALQTGVLKGRQLMQVKHELNDLPDLIDRYKIWKEFLKELSYPLYFLDFETFQPAIPLFDDSRPYQQIPFMYSLHWIEFEGDELHHTVSLAYPGRDPRRSIAEDLCHDIPEGACTLAYNMGFEKGRIKELAALYPDLEEHLMDIFENMKDLMVPFQQGWYYNRAMHGSYSIKYVLPALFPGDPELDYHNLDGVHNGTEASETYLAMWHMPDDEIVRKCEELDRYCSLDTYAMVKVWEKLNESLTLE